MTHRKKLFVDMTLYIYEICVHGMWCMLWLLTNPNVKIQTNIDIKIQFFSSQLVTYSFSNHVEAWSSCEEIRNLALNNSVDKKLEITDIPIPSPWIHKNRLVSSQLACGHHGSSTLFPWSKFLFGQVSRHENWLHSSSYI